MGAPKGNKNAAGNAGGQPTKYQAGYVEWAEKLCKLGATNPELAEAFDVAPDTISEWLKVHVEFSEAVKNGREFANANVASRLYGRAMGYSHPDTHFSSYEGQVTETPTIKHYPPDTAACIFWLKNRRPDKWRDKVDVSVSGGIAVEHRFLFEETPETKVIEHEEK